MGLPEFFKKDGLGGVLHFTSLPPWNSEIMARAFVAILQGDLIFGLYFCSGNLIITEEFIFKFTFYYLNIHMLTSYYFVILIFLFDLITEILGCLFLITWLIIRNRENTFSALVTNWPLELMCLVYSVIIFRSKSVQSPNQLGLKSLLPTSVYKRTLKGNGVKGIAS